MKASHIANILLDMRTSMGLTQKDIAERAEITESFYCLLENGHRRPSVAVAKKVAAALGFDWTLFFSDTHTS